MRPRTSVGVALLAVVALLGVAAWLLSVPVVVVASGCGLLALFIGWRMRRGARNGKPSGAKPPEPNPERETQQS